MYKEVEFPDKRTEKRTLILGFKDDVTPEEMNYFE